MAICQDDYCADPLGTHTELSCDDSIQGGLPQLVLFKCKPVSASNPTEVADMIAAGTAWKWSGVLGGIPEASPVEIDAQKSCGDSIVTRIDRTMDISDSNISAGNINWFNLARRGKYAQAILYNCSSGESLSIIPSSVLRLRGTVTWPNQNNDVAKFVGQLYWNNIDDPTLITTPDGIFS